MHRELPELETHPQADLQCVRAVTAGDHAQASALVERVYAQRLQLSCSRAQVLGQGSQHAVLLVRSSTLGVVASMTLQACALSPGAAPEPLELEHNYVLETLGIRRESLGEVRRMAVLPGCSQALRPLLVLAIQLSEQVGVTHWLGLVEATGSSSSDVPLLHRVLQAHDLLAPDLPLRPLQHDELYLEHHRASRSAFRREQLKLLTVPRRVRSFASVLEARAASVPSLHPHFPRVVVPMLAELRAFRARWL